MRFSKIKEEVEEYNLPLKNLQSSCEKNTSNYN